MKKTLIAILFLSFVLTCNFLALPAFAASCGASAIPSCSGDCPEGQHCQPDLHQAPTKCVCKNGPTCGASYPSCNGYCPPGTSCRQNSAGCTCLTACSDIPAIKDGAFNLECKDENGNEGHCGWGATPCVFKIYVGQPARCTCDYSKG